MDRWRRPLLLLVAAWVVLAVAWTVVEIAAHLTAGATPLQWFTTIARLGSIAVGVWILRAFRRPRVGSGERPPQ